MNDLFVIVLFAIVLLGVWFFERNVRNRRTSELREFAEAKGFQFEEKPDTRIVDRFGELFSEIRRGHSRYGRNLLSGRYRDFEMTLFDYHFTTGSGKNRKKHVRSVTFMQLSREYPKLSIAPEGLISKAVQSLGFDDIDFESHEFSSRYAVKSDDKKFAYDFCNAQMIELLLERDRAKLKINQNYLMLDWRDSAFDSKISVEKITPHFEDLLEIHSRIPSYLLEGAHQ